MKTSDEEPDSARNPSQMAPIIVKTSIIKRPLADLTFESIWSDQRKRLAYLARLEHLRHFHGKVIIEFQKRGDGKLALSKHKSNFSAGGW